VEHNRGDLPAVVAGGEVERLDSSPGEVARGIETNGCWLVLKHVETDPEYGRLLDETLDELVPAVGRREGGMRKREAFVFLSAPGSVTPSHVDPEHNILLQVRGTKDVNVGSFSDPGKQQRELERFYGGGHRNIETLPDEARTFRLEPGDAVYVPPNAPHWVQNGDAVSVSFSITFRTDASEGVEQLHAVNAKLRRLGLSPRPPAGRLSDRAKIAAWRTLKRLSGRR
jgi:quercetin dioxygenase-like cupin family protein